MTCACEYDSMQMVQPHSAIHCHYQHYKGIGIPLPTAMNNIRPLPPEKNNDTTALQNAIIRFPHFLQLPDQIYPQTDSNLSYWKMCAHRECIIYT